MRGIFNIDGPVISIIIKIFDCMCLSILWAFCSLPVITAGASTTALYHTIYRYIRKEEGSLLKNFFKAFRENWKRSTIVWLVVLAISGLMIVDILVFRTMALQGQALGKLYGVILFLCALLLTWEVYLMAYTARFQGTVRDVLKISFSLMMVHPFNSILVFVVLMAGIFLSISNAGFLTITPAAVCWLCSILIERVFQYHIQSSNKEIE